MHFIETVWPFWLLAFIILPFAIKSRNKYRNKYKKSTTGNVIDLIKNSKYDNNGYLIDETYDIVIQSSNKQYVVEKSMFAYDVGDTISFVLHNGKPKILNVTNNCFYSFNIVHPQLYKILLITIAILFISPIIMLSGEIPILSNAISVFLPGIIVLWLQCVITKHTNQSNSQNNMQLTKVNATIVDVRKYVRNLNRQYSEPKYYYNVVYNYKGQEYFVNLPIAVSSNINMIGHNIDININSTTGKYITFKPNNAIFLYRFVQIFFSILFLISLLQIIF